MRYKSTENAEKIEREDKEISEVGVKSDEEDESWLVPAQEGRVAWEADPTNQERAEYEEKG